MAIEFRDQDEVDLFTDIAWPRSGPYIPNEPEPPQHAFLWLDCIDAFYGGAAGGGKSDALLMGALQYVDIPGYAALLLRKTYTELNLENALLDRSHKWLAHTDAQWNGEHNRWTFPSGARIYFGYLANMKDRARYQSAEYQYIGFDELTAFTEGDFRFMFSRIRKPPFCSKTQDLDKHPDHIDAEVVWDGNVPYCSACGALVPPVSLVPLRMRSASNPGGTGHRWVKDRYVSPFLEGRVPADKEGNPNRIFIPAKLSDNPHINKDAYMLGLEELDEETRAQLLEGDWNAREPGDWMIPDHRWVDEAEELGFKLWNEGPPPPVGGAVSIGIDWGEHTQAYVIWPLEGGGVFIPPCEVVGLHEDPAIVSHKILQAALKFGYEIESARYDAAGVQSMRTFVNIARKMPGLERLKSTGVPFNKYKSEAIGYLRTLLRRVYAGEHTRVIAIHPDNAELLRQLRSWRRKYPELDVAVKEDDHGPDGVLAGIAPIARAHRQFIERQQKELMDEADQDRAYLRRGEENPADDFGGYIDTEAIIQSWEEAA